MRRPQNDYLLSLGSNIDPERWIPRALGMLGARFCAVEVSPLYDVEAVGAEGQPRFVNLAVRVTTDLPPRALREVCRSLEAVCGRVRTDDPFAPRTLDVDVVFGAQAWPAAEGLPHPDLTQAGYVLVPCAAVWPDAREPASGRTLAALAAEAFPGWDAAHRRASED